MSKFEELRNMIITAEKGTSFLRAISDAEIAQEISKDDVKYLVTLMFDEKRRQRHQYYIAAIVRGCDYNLSIMELAEDNILSYNEKLLLIAEFLNAVRNAVRKKEGKSVE